MRTYVLWHPVSPGVRVLVRRSSPLRRAGINRSAFATLGETKNNPCYFYPLTTHCPAGDVDLTGRTG